MGRSSLWAMGLSCALLPAAAFAQQGAPRNAAAEALFRDGRRLMAAGKLDEACPKFAAAQKLDPTITTALNIGECLERAGKTASAWAAFDEARTLARRAADATREAEAERRLRQLDPKLARLLLVAPPGGIPAGAEVRIDGIAVGAAAVGTGIPVDPGAHVIEVVGPGGAARTEVTVPARAGTTSASLALPAAHPPIAAPPPAVIEPPLVSPWGPQRIAGVSVGAAGLAALAVGSIFGAQALAKKSASDDGPCDAHNLCDAVGKQLRAEGMRAGNVSTALFVAGAAGVAAGVVVFLTAPKPAAGSARVSLSVGAGRVDLLGRW